MRSPVPQGELESAAQAFGVTPGSVRDQIEALNGSLLLLVQDEVGRFWRYKHPTVGDAFARHVAGSPELVEVYLRGAKPESIMREVVCAGISISGAPVVIPDTLHSLLADRIGNIDIYRLESFLSYRSNRAFTELMLNRHPEILRGMKNFSSPIKDDLDASFLATLHSQGLLRDELRLNFVEALRRAAIEEADASFLDDPSLGAVLTSDERQSILEAVDAELMPHLSGIVSKIRGEWDSDYPPDNHFDYFERSIKLFSEALADRTDHSQTLAKAATEIRSAISSMNEKFEPPSSTSAPTASSTPSPAGLFNIFRDIDE